MNFPLLNFPEKYNFQLKQEKEKIFIYDILRRKFVQLTAEEYVRQHWLHFLLMTKQKSKHSLLIEKKIELNQQTKRLDLLVMQQTQPHILLEFKAFDVALSQAVFEQIARYNIILKCSFIVLSNGILHQCYHYNKENNEYKSIDFSDLVW